MARVSIANRAKLSWLLLRGGLRRLAGRLNGHPLLRWPRGPIKADRLLIAPQELRTADATRATEIYSGRFAFAGKVVVCDSRSIFEMTPPSDEWATELLGFGWLRHLRAANSGITRANARALVDEWIALQGSWHPLAWRPDVLSRRIISWLSQAPLVLQDADVRFYRRFLRSLIRQIRYLRHTAGHAHRGVGRMQATIALSYAALCIAGQARHIKSATARLKSEIERQILPDGGHVSRDPGAIIEVLLELLPLRQAFASRNIAPPPAAAQRHRPHDADAALLPPFGGNVRAFQRHGRDARRAIAHAPGLRREPRRAAVECAPIPAISAWRPAAAC